MFESIWHCIEIVRDEIQIELIQFEKVGKRDEFSITKSQVTIVEKPKRSLCPHTPVLFRMFRKLKQTPINQTSRRVFPRWLFGFINEEISV